MAEFGALEGLQALHRELLSICEHRFENLHILEQSLQAHAEAFQKLLDKPPRASESRKAVSSGKLERSPPLPIPSRLYRLLPAPRIPNVEIAKIKIDEEDYTLNADFIDSTLRLADELDLDEIQAARILLEAEGDQAVLGQSLLECGIIRFHQQRMYLLDSIRLCIQIAADENIDDGLRDGFGQVVESTIYCVPAAGSHSLVGGGKLVPRCMSAMKTLKDWLQKLSEKDECVQSDRPGEASRV